MALICNPPPLRFTNGKIRRLQTRKIASSRNRKQPNQKKIPKKKWHCRLCYGCLWVLQLASLMTADLDAQPRLTKHFDSPFVVRLRLCFSPFFYCLFIVQVFAKDHWCLLSIASYYHYPCCSHETARLSIYVLSGQGGFLAFHHCGVYPCS